MTKKKVVSQTSHVDSDKVGDTAAAGTKRVYRGTFEAQWTCTSCGRSGIPGRQKRCPSCGNPKGTDEDYEAGEGAVRYLTPEELKGMGVDPKQHLSDEACDYCGAKLKPGTQKCPNCGAALGDVGYTTRVCPACSRESNADKCPNCGALTEEKLVAHREARPPAPKVTPPKPAASTPVPFYKQRVVIIFTAIIALLCLCGACFAIISAWRHDETATVSALAWERTIKVEEHQYNRHEDWTLPSGADLESREERIHHYDKVQIGTEERCGNEQRCESRSVYDHTEKICYDDGTCDEEDVYRTEQKCHDEYVCKDVPVYEDVPRYETWYVYSVWEWVEVEPAVARGTDNVPKWPKVNLSKDQREGARSEECKVTFTNEKGHSYVYPSPCSELERFDIGTEWQIRHDANRVHEVTPLD